METSVSTQSAITQSEPADRTLQTKQLYSHDYMLVFLRDRLHLPDAMIVLISVLVPGFVLLVLAPTAGYRLGFATVSDLLYTIRAVLQVFLIFPGLAYLSVILPERIAHLFNTLYQNGAIAAPRTSLSYEAFLARYVKVANHIGWFAGAILVVVVFWLYRLLQPDSGLLWLRVAFLVISSLMLYAAFYSIMRVLVALVFMNLLFRDFDIHVNPLHPDGSAGLSVLGDMLTLSALLMLTVGVAVVAMNSAFLSMETSASVVEAVTRFTVVDVILLCFISLVLGPTLLIGWLLLPHRVMVEARNEVLAPLAQQFEKAVEEIKLPETEVDTKASTDHLTDLKNRYVLLQDTYPTAPMSVQALRRSLLTIVLPALIPLITALISYFTKNGLPFIK